MLENDIPDACDKPDKVALSDSSGKGGEKDAMVDATTNISEAEDRSRVRPARLPPEVTQQAIDRLTLLKLELECKQLGSPWWKKPAYLGAIIPVMLALGTISAAFFSGRIQAELDKLDAKTQLLAIKTAEHVRSQQSLAALEKDLQKRRVEYDRATEKLKLAGVDEHLRALESTKEAEVPNHSSVALLARAIRSTNDKVVSIAAAEDLIARSTERPVLQLNLRIVLWHVSGEDKYRNAVVAQIREDSTHRIGPFWWSLARDRLHQWSPDQRGVILQALMEVVPTDVRIFAAPGYLLSALRNHLEPAMKVVSEDPHRIEVIDPLKLPGGMSAYIRLLEVTRQIVRDKGEGAYERTMALSILREYSPLLHLMAIANTLTAGESNQQLVLYIDRTHLGDLVFGKTDRLGEVFSVPRRSDEDWESWIGRNKSREAIRLASDILDGNYVQLKKRPDRIHNLLVSEL